MSNNFISHSLLNSLGADPKLKAASRAPEAAPTKPAIAGESNERNAFSRMLQQQRDQAAKTTAPAKEATRADTPKRPAEAAKKVAPEKTAQSCDQTQAEEVPTDDATSDDVAAAPSAKAAPGTSKKVDNVNLSSKDTTAIDAEPTDDAPTIKAGASKGKTIARNTADEVPLVPQVVTAAPTVAAAAVSGTKPVATGALAQDAVTDKTATRSHAIALEICKDGGDLRNAGIDGNATTQTAQAVQSDKIGTGLPGGAATVTAAANDSFAAQLAAASSEPIRETTRTGESQPSQDVSGIASPSGAAAIGGGAPRISMPADAPVVTLATPTDAPEFKDALAAQVSIFARDGVQHAQLHLNPGDMGPIAIQIVTNGTNAHVDFAADSAQTRALIEAGLPQLASALREAGLTLSGGGVSQQSPGRQDGGARQGEGGGTTRRMTVGGVESTGPAPRPTLGGGRTARGGLDLYA